MCVHGTLSSKTLVERAKGLIFELFYENKKKHPILWKTTQVLPGLSRDGTPSRYKRK